MAAFTRIEKGMRWYVMRDLKRANAKVPAYKLLEGMKMEVFSNIAGCVARGASQ